jgi:hypothetical protein
LTAVQKAKIRDSTGKDAPEKIRVSALLRNATFQVKDLRA